SPVFTACSTACPLITGSMPGNPASTGETCALGAAPKPADAPEKSLDSVKAWAWTSSPITTSHSPVSPLSNACVILRPFNVKRVHNGNQFINHLRCTACMARIGDDMQTALRHGAVQVPCRGEGADDVIAPLHDMRRHMFCFFPYTG